MTHKMSPMEHAALAHSNAELRYRKSPQYKMDQEADRISRAASDRKHGHSTNCTLSRCANDCPSLTRK